MPLLDKLSTFVASTPNMTGLVVGVSGGADSVALLRGLLNQATPKPLIIAHVNHQLRGLESDGDESFVRDLCEKLSVDCSALRFSTERITPSHSVNLEAAARRDRYRFFQRLAAANGIRHVATAHTANDQAETILHRLLRGTGLRGLRGIARERPLGDGVSLVRPMLEITRDDVMAYLRMIDQPFREDSSNADRRLTRNRIRHELLPLLASNFNPAVVTLLTRLAHQTAEVYAEIEREAEHLLKRCEKPRAGRLVILDAVTFADASRPVRRESLGLLWQREHWPMGDMRFREWDRLINLADSVAADADFPGGIHVRRRGTVLQLGRNNQADMTSAINVEPE